MSDGAHSAAPPAWLLPRSFAPPLPPTQPSLPDLRAFSATSLYTAGDLQDETDIRQHPAVMQGPKLRPPEALVLRS